MKYDIRDISLAPYGHQKIEWVRDHMLPMYGTRKSNNPLIPDTKYVFYILKVEEILNY
jgi:S-adenosylhomocysteine hydrolase